MSEANLTLYNNCPMGKAPVWADFDATEVHPCHTPDDGLGHVYEGCYETCEPHEAEIWTVYGHCRTGGLSAITDVSTRKLAYQLAAIFERSIKP